jgi:hypothetical protein
MIKQMDRHAVDAEHKRMHGEKYGEYGNVLSPGKITEFSLWKKGCREMDDGRPWTRWTWHYGGSERIKINLCHHNDVILILFLFRARRHGSDRSGAECT